MLGLKEGKFDVDYNLVKILIFVNIIQFFNTFLNVVHKLRLIKSSNAHIAMAILSIIVLLGYSGILNTIFLKRNFGFGRILYIAVALLSQVVVLLLSFLSYGKVITYFDAIAIIHGIFGFIVIINFTASILVVDEQQKQIEELDNEKQKIKIKEKIKLLEKATRRASIFTLYNDDRRDSYKNDRRDSYNDEPLNNHKKQEIQLSSYPN